MNFNININDLLDISVVYSIGKRYNKIHNDIIVRASCKTRFFELRNPIFEKKIGFLKPCVFRVLQEPRTPNFYQSLVLFILIGGKDESQNSFKAFDVIN